MTNGDVVRQMTNSDLEELWSIQSFNTRYWPECSHDEKIGCRYWNFSCDACPATFRNLLEEKAEE